MNTEIERNENELGLATAELLGNAALGVAALVLIWGVLSAVGVNIVQSIGNAIGL